MDEEADAGPGRSGRGLRELPQDVRQGERVLQARVVADLAALAAAGVALWAVGGAWATC